MCRSSASIVENGRAATKNPSAKLQEQLETAKAEAEQPFPRDEELKEKTARLDELNILLNLDKKENEIVDSDVTDDAEEKPTADRGAR